MCGSRAICVGVCVGIGQYVWGVCEGVGQYVWGVCGNGAICVGVCGMVEGSYGVVWECEGF